jgi:cyclophilin family peptidyl-prolyl cis-trans isomerase
MGRIIFLICSLLIMSAVLAGEKKDSVNVDPVVYADSQVVLQTSLGDIALDLFPDVSPRHVTSFVKLVNMGFYDSLTFHRAIPGTLIQGGSPDGSPTGQGPWKVPAELSDLKHGDGTLAMARPTDINGATCQFYISLRNMPFLDGKYTIFGHTADSLSLAVAHRISRVETTGKQPFPKISDLPHETVLIERAYMRARPESRKP